MQKSSFIFILAALLIPSLGFADQIAEFGLGLTPKQMTEQDFRSKIREDFQVFEKKDDSSRLKVLAQKNDFVAYLKNTTNEGTISYTKLNQSGQVLNQTKCLRVANEKSRYNCSTLSHNYCHALFSKMDSGAFAKVKECSSILNTIPYSSKEISSAQTNALQVFETAFATTPNLFKTNVPESINSLEQLLNDFAACSKLKEKLAVADNAKGTATAAPSKSEAKAVAK
jgi:hypothetical protein